MCYPQFFFLLSARVTRRAGHVVQSYPPFFITCARDATLGHVLPLVFFCYYLRGMCALRDAQVMCYSATLRFLLPARVTRRAGHVLPFVFLCVCAITCAACARYATRRSFATVLPSAFYYLRA